MPKLKLDATKAQERSATTATAEKVVLQQQRKRALLPLEKIQDRPTGDTRKLNQEHTQMLAESISVLGLISPLTVDRHYHLLAGGHRKAALQQLAEQDPERFEELFGEGIPVNLIDIDASDETLEALQIEVEENTQRKNYTTGEIKKAARKLEEAGYQKLQGRPRKGQKSLNRELMNVFGLSRRRVTQILNPKETTPEEKSAHLCALFSKLQKYQDQTRKLKADLEQDFEGLDTGTLMQLDTVLQTVEEEIEELIPKLEKAIKSRESSPQQLASLDAADSELTRPAH